jgi:hypothetical protein
MSKVTLITLDQKLDFLVNKLTEHIAQDQASFNQITYDLNGNGKPGLKTEVDRLVQTEVSRRWHFRAIWGAVVAAIIGWFIK